MNAGVVSGISMNLRALFCILSSLLVLGCATTQEVGRMQWELNELKSDVKKMRKSSQTVKTPSGQTQPLDAKLKELEDAQNATAKTVSDLLVDVQSLTSELQILTGRFEEARYFSEKSSAELLQSKDTLMTKVNELELAIEDLRKRFPESTAEQKRDESPIASEEKKQAIQEPGERSDIEPGTSEIRDVYMAGYQAFREGKNEEARKKFRSLLNDYGENKYSDNARFWIAESYYKDESYEDAILAYEELFKKNPDSDKVPGAMLKQGLAFYALKDRATGKIILERLIEKFPDSEQAKLARKKIKKPLPPKKRN